MGSIKISKYQNDKVLPFAFFLDPPERDHELQLLLIALRWSWMNFFFIGPESDYCLALSNLHSLINEVMLWRLFDEDAFSKVVDIVTDVEVGVEESDGNSLTTAFS